MPVVRLAALCTPAAFCGVFLHQGFLWMVLVMSLFGFFWNASLPQFEANTMRHLGQASHSYGRLRLWGSVGFIAAVAGAGGWLEGANLGRVPALLLVTMVGAGLISFLVPEAPRRKPPLRLEDQEWIDWKQVRLFFAVCFLMQASHGPFYTFFSIHLDAVGYSRTATGWLWSIGVVAEIAVFVWLASALRRLGERTVLLSSLALAALRWILIGLWAEYALVLIFAQLLHAATFGAFHAVAMIIVQRLFSESARGRGQALYSSFGFGAGGAFGGILSGTLWGDAGAAATFCVAAFLAVIALLLGTRLRFAPIRD
jgi:MFS transporter, PPP family, 3-phenylpropionic acid transporter